ncbi:hypothetical protein [Bradyrhizobium sp. GM2.2]|uniref:hypothetical protein n=1 Tax=Bradyrhizobium sp. GM2.2 TaxID=3156358 RepID=UPI003392BA1F
MQIDGEAEGQASSIGKSSDSEVEPSSNEGLRTKKIIVQLSESIFERLEAATERAGVGKSMVVDTALQRFLAPAPAAEGLIRETPDRFSGQMARLEREVAIVAETVGPACALSPHRYGGHAIIPAAGRMPPRPRTLQGFGPTARARSAVWPTIDSGDD